MLADTMLRSMPCFGRYLDSLDAILRSKDCYLTPCFARCRASLDTLLRPNHTSPDALIRPMDCSMDTLATRCLARPILRPIDTLLARSDPIIRIRLFLSRYTDLAILISLLSRIFYLDILISLSLSRYFYRDILSQLLWPRFRGPFL